MRPEGLAVGLRKQWMGPVLGILVVAVVAFLVLELDWGELLLFDAMPRLDGERVDIDDVFFSLLAWPSEDWTVKNGTIYGKSWSRRYANLYGGDRESRWTDFHLELEVRLGEGQTKLRLGIGFTAEDPPEHLYEMENVPLGGGQWHRLRIESGEGRFVVLDAHRSQELFKLNFVPEEGFMVSLDRGQEIWIRRVILKPVENTKR